MPRAPRGLKPISVIFAWFLASAVFAQSPSAPIVVEAERVTPELERGKTGAATVVDLAEQRGSAAGLADVLERETSVRVRRYGGRGYQSTLSVRGSNPNQVNIYMDGIPLSDAVTGELNLEDYNLDGMDRLEIFRSGDFSGSPIGGSLNMITRRRGKQKEGARVKSTAGSFKTFGAGGDVFGGDDLQYNLSARGETSDQNFTFHNDNGTPILNDWDDFDDTRTNAQYKNYFSTLNLNGKVGRTELFFLNDGARRKHGVPGPVPTQTEKTERRLERNTSGIGTDSKGLFVDWLRLETRAYYTENRQRFLDPRQEFSFNQPNARRRLIQRGFHLSPTLYLLDYYQTLRIFAGVDYEQLRAEDRDRYDHLIERLPQRTREQQTIRLEDEIAFFDERWIMTPSAEYKRYLDRSPEKKTVNDANVGAARLRNIDRETRARLERNYEDPDHAEPPRLFDPEHKDTKLWNYRFGSRVVLWREKGPRDRTGTAEDEAPRGEWFLRGSYGTGTRLPLFVELFGERGSIIGNPDLLPERSESYEIGTGGTLRYGPLRGSLELTGFRRDIRDMILFVPNSQFTLRPENVDAARVRGAELSGRVQAFETVKVYGNYTYQRAINDSDVEALRGKYLPLRPLHEFSGGLALFNDHWESGIEGIYVGAVFRDRTNELPGWVAPRWLYNYYIRWSLYGARDKDRELLVGLEIKNIQNRRVTDIVGYPLPGRAAYVTVSYKF